MCIPAECLGEFPSSEYGKEERSISIATEGVDKHLYSLQTLQQRRGCVISWPALNNYTSRVVAVSLVMAMQY